MFFTFDQNNVHGKYIQRPAEGIAAFVVVEAANADHAEEIMAHVAADTVLDSCSCCGRRWYLSTSQDDATSEPEVYGWPVLEYSGSLCVHGICVVYLSGRIEYINDGVLTVTRSE